jgi:16S rRNA processing protein RimM
MTQSGGGEPPADDDRDDEEVVDEDDDAYAEDGDDVVEIGTVSKAHGVRGEVLVVLIDPASTTLDDVETVWIGDAQHTVNQARPIGGAYLLALEGLTDRDAAAALRGRSVSVARDAIVLDDQQILYADLIGCRCELPDGTAWGTIVAIELGPQDRLVVHHDHKLDGTPGDVERLVPFVDAFIASIDIEAGRVVITPPEGMPEEPR